MKKIKNYRGVLLIVLLFTSILPLAAQDNVIDQVIWVVGDEAIFKSEVEEARLYAISENRKFDGDPYCIIPEELAIQKLYLHQAQLDSITATESEVMQHVDYYENMYVQNIGSVEKVEEYFNKKMSQIRDELRETQKASIIVNKMQQKIVGDIKVTPAEVRQYYKSLPKDSIPFVPTQVEVQILTQNPMIPESEIDDVKKRLRDYTERVEKGETSFSTLALLYSEDKGTAANGGEMPFMGKGQLDPDFATAAFNITDPNKVSKIVKSEYGYHIIQLIEKRGDRIKVRHILLRPHVPDKSVTDALARLDSISNDIRDKKFTFDEAATMLSMDKDTRLNHGILVNEKENTTSPRFQMEELPQEIGKVVDKLSVGEISKPFTMIDKDGKEICAVAKLKNRINGHKADITDDYTSVKEMLMNERREETLKKWIAEKQKRTYIRIDPSWQKCDFKYPGWIKK